MWGLVLLTFLPLAAQCTKPPERGIFFQSFRARFPNPADDYVHMRMQLMVDTLAQAIDKAGTTDAKAVAAQLEHARVTFGMQTGAMRAADHQFQQPLAPEGCFSVSSMHGVTTDACIGSLHVRHGDWVMRMRFWREITRECADRMRKCFLRAPFAPKPGRMT